VVKRIIQVDTVLFQEEVTEKGHRLFLGVAIRGIPDTQGFAVAFQTPRDSPRPPGDQDTRISLTG